jgi:hypothetical protein
METAMLTYTARLFRAKDVHDAEARPYCHAVDLVDFLGGSHIDATMVVCDQENSRQVVEDLLIKVSGGFND